MRYLYCTLLIGSFMQFTQHAISWAETTLASMSLQQKIGQLFMVATASSFEQPEELLASALFKCPYRMEHDYIEFLIHH